MSGTLEACWRHRTRTPVLLVTACAWLAVLEVAAWQQPRPAPRAAMTMPGHGDAVVLGTAGLMLGLMTASMMAPFLIEPVRHGVARSLRSRRTRAVGLVVGAHLLVWTVCGVVAQVSVGLLVARVGSAPALTAALLAALVWQASPMAQRLANRHHAHPPLAAFGRAADVGLVGYGVRHAAACWGACWPVMLLPAVDGAHALAAMALGSLWIWAFALEGPARPEWRVPWPARAVRLAQARLTSLRGVARETLRRWFPTLCR